MSLMKKFLCYIFIIYSLQANANIYLDAPKNAIANKEYKFDIIAIGSSVKFGDIDEIGKYSVTQIASTKSITTQNGKQEFMYKKSFALTPKDDFKLPLFKITIDGKDYYTKSQIITTTSPSQTISDKFELTITSNKQTAYIGEQINYSVIFKYKDDIQIADLEFVSAEFSNFWSKTLDNNTKIYKKDGYNIQELYFLLFAQKSGNLEIKPSKINLTIANKYDENSIFNTPDEEITIHSNPLKFDIKQLPNDVSLIGDFKITTKIDKETITKGEAVNFQIQIQGIGNIDDTDDINLKIENTTIYSNKAQKDYFVKSGLYGGTYTKSFSILAQDDFVIPSIKLKYYDYKNNITKETNTDLYYINVDTSSSSSNNTKIKQDYNKSSSFSQSSKKIITNKPKKNNPKIINLNNNQKIFYISLGFLSAVLLFVLFAFIKQFKSKNHKSDNNQNRDKIIQKCKTPQELLDIILPYINKHKDLDNIIYALEELSYNNENKTYQLKEIKKEIIQLMQIVNSKENEDEKDPFYTNDHI